MARTDQSELANLRGDFAATACVVQKSFHHYWHKRWQMCLELGTDGDRYVLRQLDDGDLHRFVTEVIAPELFHNFKYVVQVNLYVLLDNRHNDAQLLK